MEFIIKRFEELTVDELYEILKVRVSVFVVEQECPYQEVDEKDKNAYHVFIKGNEGIKAYLRVLDKGISFEEVSIGRVLTTERGIGLGDKILEKGIEVAKEKMNADKIRIEAQCYAKGFYERFGFKQVSDEFLEDGIPHIEMLLE
ncbi:GNAT family N-acetyltransferase [Alloiococcus sp. CFN-8]|uniref:GNAT family N-acetyltransferase n=1 Tax=Alloiococcus sp. CFN-8 TaxID=3416081 RepID=UPI003CF6D504